MNKKTLQIALLYIVNEEVTADTSTARPGDDNDDDKSGAG